MKKPSTNKRKSSHKPLKRNLRHCNDCYKSFKRLEQLAYWHGRRVCNDCWYKLKESQKRGYKPRRKTRTDLFFEKYGKK